jgi:hypothetical protein
MRYILALIVGMIFMYFLMEPEPPQQEVIKVEEPKPDPNREVDHFDWKDYKYIYKDELKPEKKREYTPTDLDKVIPEMTVEVISQDSPEKAFFEKIGNKYYRVYYMPNGTRKLKEAR